MRLYLAGPDVFLPDAERIGAKKKRICQEFGVDAHFPLDTVLDIDLDHPKAQTARAIFDANCTAILACTAVLANMTPFRGPSADAGTVWETGFAYARGIPVFGYSNCPTPFADRTRSFLSREPDPLQVEDFGLVSDNLMLHFGMAAFFPAKHEDPARQWSDLGSFREAAEAAAAFLFREK